jgi:hypothetical protein
MESPLGGGPSWWGGEMPISNIRPALHIRSMHLGKRYVMTTINRRNPNAKELQHWVKDLPSKWRYAAMYLRDMW